MPLVFVATDGCNIPHHFVGRKIVQLLTFECYNPHDDNKIYEEV